MIQASEAVKALMAERAQANEQASEAAVNEMAQFMESCGYSSKVNPLLFKALCKLGANEIEKKGNVGLFIKGDVGIGKSYGLQILSKQFDWEYRQAVDVETYYSKNQHPESWENYCRGDYFFGHPKTLVIDDLGTESFPFMLFGSKKNPLAELLDYRYRVSYLRDKTRTIITCNLTDKEIQERYGYRIYDRMNEMFYIIKINGESQRGKRK